MEEVKPVVFVIIPFSEDFLDVFDELKRKFEAEYEFINAGDMDNQQSILKDIVEGIANADVIIADLTGLNSNVFYELGLAHAMGKKTIIITQNIAEVPFDIRAYRVNQYSLKFNKFPALITELEKLLRGAMDGSIKYGNPVKDYAPEYPSSQVERTAEVVDAIEVDNNEIQVVQNENEDSGYLDLVTSINENAQNMADELGAVNSEMIEVSCSVTNTVEEINRVKEKSGNVDPVFAMNSCRRLSEPVDKCAEKLKIHIESTTQYWEKIENSYLELLDNSFMKKSSKIEEVKQTILSLNHLKEAVSRSNDQIEKLIISAQGIIGMERRLTKATKNLISVLHLYLTMTDTISSSIDRINTKSEIVMREVSK